jgi:hypothetical protein
MDKANWIYIEHEGRLHRGFTVGWPREIWSIGGCVWTPYAGEVPRPHGWGERISEVEFRQWIAEPTPGR